MDDQNEPTGLIELLYERSFATLKKIASIYEEHGHTDKAEEITSFLRDHDNDEQTRGAA
jgi:hypothetical protein